MSWSPKISYKYIFIAFITENIFLNLFYKNSIYAIIFRNFNKIFRVYLHSTKSLIPLFPLRRTTSEYVKKRGNPIFF